VFGNLTGTIHIEKEIKASVAQVYKCFQQKQALRIWYDPRCHITRFSVGGKLVGDNYPSAEIVALVRNHMIVHRYSDVVPGFGIWSFVGKSASKSMLLILDHLNAYENKEDRKSITFYWKGLVENLAALCESRKLPFDHDTGDYVRNLRH